MRAFCWKHAASFFFAAVLFVSIFAPQAALSGDCAEVCRAACNKCYSVTRADFIWRDTSRPYTDTGNCHCECSSTPDFACVGDGGYGGCPPCYYPTGDRSDTTCKKLANCTIKPPPPQMFPYIEGSGLPPAGTGGYPDILPRGYWNGDCGTGVFGHDGDDIWRSRTGCYNPEERFSYTDYTAGRTFGKPSARRPGSTREVGSPRDDILIRHPECIKKRFGLPRPGARVETALKKGELEEGEIGYSLNCMQDDYVDDVDDFCGDYVSTKFYPGTRFVPPTCTPARSFTIDGRQVTSTHTYCRARWKFDTTDNCWVRDASEPAVLDILPSDHYMPLSLELPTGHTEYPPENNNEALGEYGYGSSKTPGYNHPIKKQWTFSRGNVYGMGTAPARDDVLKIDNMGAKAKRKECLKLYIEEWAHRGDCGEIVLEGARADINTSYCQWVAQKDTSNDQSGLNIPPYSFNLDPPDRATGMRNEYYDFENFRSAGFVPSFSIPPARSSVCLKKLSPSGENVFDSGKSGDLPDATNMDGRLDFSKRGCPTVTGPDFWPPFFEMKSCDFSRGAYRINSGDNPYAVMKKFWTAPFMTTDMYATDRDVDFVWWALPAYSLVEAATQVTAEGLADLMKMPLAGVPFFGWNAETGGVPLIPRITSPTIKLSDWREIGWNRGKHQGAREGRPIYEIPTMPNPPGISNPTSSLTWPPSGTPGYPNFGGIPIVALPLFFNEPFGDWADPSWAARSCTTAWLLADNYDGQADVEFKMDLKKLADVKIDDLKKFGRLPGGQGLPPLGVAVSERKVGSRTSTEFIYKRDPVYYNATQLLGSHWCEFQVPYHPYRNGSGLNNGQHDFYLQMHNFPSWMQSRNNKNDDLGVRRFNLGYKRIERIRDACGAFNNRGTWSEDKHKGLSEWLTGKERSRCANWRGMYAKKYDDIKLVSWRLPRFDYEFIKAFIECTGPVKGAPGVCEGGFNWWRASKNNIPKWLGGCGCGHRFDDQTKPKIYWQKNTNNKNGTWFGDDEAFGFWCTCPDGDNPFTTTCNESFCTCDGVNVLQLSLLSGFTTVCGDYGPFRRWLQCYHQARAKACPVLEREISDGIAPASSLKYHDSSDDVPFKAPGECSASAGAPKPSGKSVNMRWAAEEANILARLPLSNESAGFGRKHYDLVFQSQVRDIEAPFMELSLPFLLESYGHKEDPVSRANMITAISPSDSRHDNGVGIRKQNVRKDDEYNKAGKDVGSPVYLSGDEATVVVDQIIRARHDAAISLENAARESAWKAFRYFAKSTPQRPHPRAQEAIVGPRGCDIGGWYEMLLYQARCIKWFKLNCLCDYDKTFLEGSAEAYVLKRAGTVFSTRRFEKVNIAAEAAVPASTIAAVPPRWIDANTWDPGLAEVFHPARPAKAARSGWEVSEGQVLWPLMWRGFAGPYYGMWKDTVTGKWQAQKNARLWDKNNNGLEDPYYRDSGYTGLDEAKPGDFVIWDETVKDPDDNDARYRRHIAYVEGTNAVETSPGNYTTPKVVWVSEWNWGKNQDSCGNTDRWKTMTLRAIYKSEKTGQPCDDPDWRDCYEPSWDKVKLYRPGLDLALAGSGHPRPVCDATDAAFPKPFGMGMTPSDIEAKRTGAKGKTPDDMKTSGDWKMFHIGRYEEDEVRKFLSENIGKCDVPYSFRGSRGLGGEVPPTP